MTFTVGDEVFKYAGGVYGAPMIGTVKRLTATQVIVEFNGSESRYRIKDGLAIGASRWDTQRIVPAEESHRVAVLRHQCECVCKDIGALCHRMRNLRDDRVREMHAKLTELRRIIKTESKLND